MSNAKIGINFSRYDEISRSGEQFISDHIICGVRSGAIEVFDGIKKYKFIENDSFLFKRNSLAQYLKYPVDGKPYQSISFTLDQPFLQSLSYARTEISPLVKIPDKSVFEINDSEPMRHLFSSLISWGGTDVPKELVQVKKEELVVLMLNAQPELANVIFDYSVPGKIDLEAFMNQHYKFNVDLPQLAFLTGRSLSTFKRDFKEIFNVSPHRWIQMKRLQEAYQQLHVKKRSASQIYMEVGFQTLAHFSFAFKKYFGENPSTVARHASTID